MILAFTVEGGALLIAFILAWYLDISLFPLSEDHLLDLVTGTAAALPPLLLFRFSLSERAAKIPLIGSLRRMVLGDIKALFSRCTLIDIIIISLLAGLAEEFLFRGVLQTKLGIVAASIIFGLFHAVSPAYVIAAAIMGFYIGAFYELSGSLLVPVQIHFAYDLAALLCLRYFISPNILDLEQ